ncbi:MAG: hypothetical protein GYA47_13220 [Desulfovibrio sp.]|nr:hypothetical protein [Desulfovibrio sp.]
MTAYTVQMEQLPKLCATWSTQYGVHVPMALGNGFYDFAPWRPGVEIAFEYDVAYNSLKRFFMPPREDMVAFDVENCTAGPVFAAPPTLLFGVHPYDIKAVTQLDQLMEAVSLDQNYFSRRDAVVIFALTPLAVADTAFWASVGADKVDRGYDLYWTKTGPGTFHVEVGSGKGEELLLAAGPLPSATAGSREAARKAQVRATKLGLSRKLLYDWHETPHVLERSWNSSVWHRKAEKCLACGSCNIVCPTCYCFDIREEVDENLKTGRRFREWDGCMLSGFALVAGGHNFRAQAAERYRHRYMRKGKYIFDKIGELGCVGCGRCVRACTSKIADPCAIFNALWEERRHEI